MKILDRYIIKTIMAMTLLVLVVLLGIDFFIELLNEFGDIGKGHYDLSQAIWYVTLSLPRDIYRLFPMVGLLGGLLGLGILATHSELIVMRVSTMSIVRISWTVITAIIIMVAVVTLLGEFVAPRLLYKAESDKSLSKSSGQAVATQHGIWVRDGESFIHVDVVSSTDQLEGVTRYDFDDNHRLVRASHAELGNYDDGVWQMQDVLESELGDDKVTTKHLETADWTMHLNPEVLKNTEVEPEEMTLSKLYSIIKYKKSNNLDYEEYAVPFWQRLLQPLATCVMMFLAIPFVFGPLRTVTMGLRLLAGIIVGFCFYNINQFFGPFSMVYQIPPLIGAMLPIGIFALLAYCLMLRVR